MPDIERPSVTRQLVGRALNKLEEATGSSVSVAGQSIIPSERLEVLEAVYEDHRVLQKELDSLGYRVLDYLGGLPQEQTTQARRRVVQQARHVWMNDPQAGAAVELMNDFCFGRGVPKPRAKDPLVQDVIDEAWDDPDNQEVLTSLEAQLALGTDVAIQSNVFVQLFDDGADGKVKLSTLCHDDVAGYMPHPTKRHRVLYYLAFKHEYEWDFQTDGFKPNPPVARELKPFYYPHWRNVELTKEEPSGADIEHPPDDRVGEGRVYHLRINRHSEQVFGVPRFQRTLRWYTAYNDFVAARLDVAKAGAAFIMKRKVTGTATAMAQAATRAMGRRSPLATASPAGQEFGVAGPRPASILEENEGATHESFNLDTRAANAQQDARMIRAPIAAAERFTQAYLGDAEAAGSLAGATSLELPILKAVEARQEVFERLIRWFLDRVIERAVDTGRIPAELAADELPDREPVEDVLEALREAAEEQVAAGRELLEVTRCLGDVAEGEEVYLIVSREGRETFYTLVESHEDSVKDEKATQRDLGYEFSMPSPLRRMLTELIGSIQQIAATFDPNNENVELSRALLTIALGEGLEVQDAPDLVELIFPPGYVAPSQAAMLQQQGLDENGRPLPAPTAGFGPADAGKPMPHGPDGAPPGAPANASRPEEIRQARGRLRPARPLLQLEEGADLRGTELVQRDTERAKADAAELFEREVVGAGMRALQDADLLGSSSGRR